MLAASPDAEELKEMQVCEECKCGVRSCPGKKFSSLCCHLFVLKAIEF